jgi:diguanylate cyclase (GGDEF)-like protein
MYAIGSDRPGRPCRHVQPARGLSYICMPLLAMNEVMGVLHLCAAGPEPAEPLDEATLELARAAADSLALALGYVGARQALREQSIRDPLTGLFNRRYMEETLERELRRGGRGGYPLGLIMLDVDGFKGFNDAFGHAAGDAALRELGSYLRMQVRGEDVACRYGGEEFMLILPEASFEVTRERAEQVREGVKQLRLRHGGQALSPLTLSLGIAAFPADGATPADLLSAADAALYQAKRLGRDRVAASPSRESRL